MVGLYLLLAHGQGSVELLFRLILAIIMLLATAKFFMVTSNEPILVSVELPSEVETETVELVTDKVVSALLSLA